MHSRCQQCVKKMIRTIRLLTLFLFSCLTALGQKDNPIKGTWVAVKIEFSGDKVTNPNNIVPTDTIVFKDNEFEQKLLVSEVDGVQKTLLWFQKGIYQISNDKLILKNRVISEGEPGKKYPDIEFKYKIKKGQLLLGEKTKLPDNQYVTTWHYYKRL